MPYSGDHRFVYYLNSDELALLLGEGLEAVPSHNKEGKQAWVLRKHEPEELTWIFAAPSYEEARQLLEPTIGVDNSIDGVGGDDFCLNDVLHEVWTGRPHRV